MTEQAKPTPDEKRFPRLRSYRLRRGQFETMQESYRYMLALAERIGCDVREVPGKLAFYAQHAGFNKASSHPAYKPWWEIDAALAEEGKEK